MKAVRVSEVVTAGAAVPALSGTLTGVAAADHYFPFTPANTTSDDSDRNGRFTGQAQTNPGHPVPMAWSFRISPAVQAIATSPMDCTAGHMQLNYHDTHAAVPVDYFWHSTVPGNQSDNTKYDLYGNCTFRVQGPGTANLKFVFHYSMFCGPCGPAGATPAGFSSRLDIAYDR